MNSVYVVLKGVILKFPALMSAYIFQMKVGIFLHAPQYRHTPYISLSPFSVHVPIYRQRLFWTYVLLLTQSHRYCWI